MDLLSLIAGVTIGIILTHLYTTKGKEELRERVVKAETRLEAEQENAQTSEEMGKQQQDIFKGIADTVLEKNLEKSSENFVKLAQQTFEKHEARTKVESKTLTERVLALQKDVLRTHTETQTIVSALQKETTSLTQALQSPKVVGDWGEMSLKNLVEMAGMSKHCDFLTLKTFSDSEGMRLRPDMIVNLPQGRTVAVDAKVPMKYYQAYFEAETEDERNKCLAKHWDNVSKHVKELGSKAYWNQLEDSPDFVVMYLGDGVYYAAVQENEQLIAQAYKNKVILTPPAMLLALLKVMAHEWRQEGLSKRAAKIDDMGKELYKRIGRVAKYLDDLGKGLGRAGNSYNDAVNSIESRLLVKAREFDRLDMNIDKEIEGPRQVEVLPKSLTAPEFHTNKEATEEND